jgi:hypothetical protein
MSNMNACTTTPLQWSCLFSALSSTPFFTPLFLFISDFQCGSLIAILNSVVKMMKSIAYLLTLLSYCQGAELPEMFRFAVAGSDSTGKWSLTSHDNLTDVFIFLILFHHHDYLSDISPGYPTDMIYSSISIICPPSSHDDIMVDKHSLHR